MTAKIPPKPEKSEQPAKPGKDTVYVDVDDEITAIIDKAEATKQKVVALVLPKRATSLQSVVNMRLLKRSADKAGKSVVLITSEAALLPLAGAAGLHVAKNLQSKPAIPPSPLEEKELPTVLDPDETDAEEINEKDAKLDHHRAIGELAAAHSGDEPETIALGDVEEPAPVTKVPKAKKGGLKIPDFDRFRLMLGLGIAGLVALILFIILALFVWPKATIAIQTTSSPLAASFDLKASGSAKALDEKAGIIPSVSKTSDQKGSQQVPATGQQNNGDKAAGNITFSIPCSAVSGSPPTIPAGTGVTTSSLGYITQSAANLTTPNFSPCRFTGSTTIKAVVAGTKYNVGTSSFTISGSGYPDVTGSGSATGGTDSIVTVVSQQDVNSAKQKIIGQNSDEFTKKFEKDLRDSGYYVLTSTLKLTEPHTDASPAIGQQASTVTVSTQTTYSVMVVKKDDLKKAITYELAKQVDSKKQKISSTDVVKDASISVQDQTSPTDAKLAITMNTTAVPIIDVDNVKKQAAGQKSGDIRAFINGIPGVTKVDVKLSPFWVSKAPKKQTKIEVKLQEIKASTNDQP